MVDKGVFKQIPILMYHSILDRNPAGHHSWGISASTFASHLDFLKNHAYVPISVTHLVSKLYSQPNTLPDKPVVLTFDDSLSDFLSHALPLLDKYGFTATIFIPTAYVSMTTSWAKNPLERNRRILSWVELQAIADHGIECGSHGHTHTQLDILSQRQMWDEVKVSKDMLEQHLQRNIESFAYPYGVNSRSLRDIVMKAGYVSGCAVKNTMMVPLIDKYSIPRIIIFSDTNLTQYKDILVGKGLKKPYLHEPFKTRLFRLFRKYRSKL